jgi:argininosuccinate lyase
MATLLMIESWLQSTGQVLPPLLDRLGHEYVLVTRDPGTYGAGSAAPHPALSGAADVVVVETNATDTTVDRAAAVAAERRIDGVITTCDHYLATAAAVAERLGLPGSPPEAMRRAVRKHDVRAALDAAGLPPVRHAVAATIDDALVAAEGLRYPLVAKPVDLNAGTSVRRVDEEAHLKDAWADITALAHNTRGQALAGVVLLEEVLDGTEVSVEAVTVDGTTHVIGVTDKSVTGPPAVVESGHMVPADLAPPVLADVEGFAAAAVDALGITHCLTHTEVMITADGPRLVELNPRRGGGYIFDLVHLVSGTHPLRVLVDLAVGETPVLGTVDAPLPSAAVPGGSAAVVFAMAPRAGRIVGVDGLDRLARAPDVHRWTLPVPVDARRPVDNEAYLGHVVATDPEGRGARARAEDLVASLRLRFDDGTTVAPLPIAGGWPATEPTEGRPPRAAPPRKPRGDQAAPGCASAPELPTKVPSGPAGSGSVYGGPGTRRPGTPLTDSVL